MQLMAGFSALFLLFHWLLLSQLSYSLPLCTDFRSPTKVKTPLEFCPYNGTTCCDSTKDLQLQKQFQAMNISDSSCASLVKSVLCSTCDPFAAELFKAKAGNEKEQKQVPGLCNSTDSESSHSSKQSATSFCPTVWNACKDVSITNSPFAPSLKGGAKGSASMASNMSTLTDLWQSEKTFCDVFGSPSDNTSVCFAGEPTKLTNTTTETDDASPKGLCLEKIGTGSYIGMAPHPDGSNRAFFSNLPGKIWMATIPEQDSGEKLDLDESDPFADLTDEVLFDTIFGMLGIAFHPDFARNGRFFASYNCDRLKSPACAGRCACNSDVDCDPSKFNNSGSSTPCQYQSVIAEFTANGSSSMESGSPAEVRRIFTMGLPYTNNHGGQIVFGPEDKYMYFMMGDGGGRGDPYKFAQNKKSILGKIMRIDVDTMPSDKEINDLGLWGNYSIPRDNPYSEDKDLAPEIWALGFRNPWRCSFDAERPSYFVCGDVGEDQYEEIDVVTKGGNYGWGKYEGPIASSSGNATKNSSGTEDMIFPVAGYTHSEINKKTGSAAISGGFFYRSDTDPCMSGRYLYGDLYASNIWAALENPENSGNFSTSALPFSCAKDSPIQCDAVPGSTLPALGYIYSFAQDNRKDIIILANTGVYRVVRPSRCKYACSKEIARPATEPSPSPSSPSNGAQSITPLKEWLFLVLSFLILQCLYN